MSSGSEKNGKRKGRETTGDDPGKSRRLFREFLTLRESGESIVPEEFISKYPELEDELLLLFEKLDDRAVEGVDLREEPAPKRGEIPSAIGDFRIVREIGRGGMGTVYEAEQISLRRRVALKVLPSHLSHSDEALRKFRREAEAGGRQSHPGIVAVHAVGEYEGSHYIAQELVEEGYTLADRLDELRRWSSRPPGYFREAAKLAAEVADAFQHAHDSGVIHRDVKPSNILLTREGRPKVSDFGLAKVEDALALSRTGDFAGTPYYMSPEQAASRRIGIDHRTDVFSLGITLYEMLTLERPFDGETSQEVLRKILLHEPRDPRKVNVHVPQDLATISLKAMEKKPENRYATMEELAGDLRRYLSGDVILARPVGAVTKLIRKARRNPAVAVAVAAVVASILFIPWSYIRMVSERDSAVTAKKEALEEAERSKVVFAFLRDLLTAADPSRDGSDVKLIDLLNRADEKIEKTFAGQPEVEAILRNTIASTFVSLGLYDQARLHREKELEIKRELYGDENPVTLEALFNLGTALHFQGEFAKAEEIYRQALEAYRRNMGGEHQNTLRLMGNLGMVLQELGKYTEAETWMRETLELQRRVFVKEHVDTLFTMSNLAAVYHSQGRYADAEEMYRKALNIQRRVLGKEHTDTLATLLTLANVMRDRGVYEEAEKYVREILNIRSRLLGEEHPKTLVLLEELATIFVFQGKFSKAEEMVKKALECQRRVLGQHHPATLDSSGTLAGILHDEGRFPEAEAYFRETLDFQRKVLGEEHPKTLGTMHRLASVLLDQGKDGEAEKLYQEAIEAQRRLLGEEHPGLLSTMNDLGTMYQVQGRFLKAEELHMKILEARRRVLGDEHLNTLKSMHNVAVSLHGQGKYSEADEMYRKGLEIQNRIYGEDHPFSLHILHNMGLLLADLGEMEKAEEQFRKVLEKRTSVLGREHPDTLATMTSLVLVLMDQGKTDEAGILNQHLAEIRRRAEDQAETEGARGEENPSPEEP